MGWYGGETTCPNCRSEKASEQFRSSCLEGYYLVCVDCGLHLHCPDRLWVVENSYFDKSIIGKNPDDLQPEDMVDYTKNDNVPGLEKGTVL